MIGQAQEPTTLNDVPAAIENGHSYGKANACSGPADHAWVRSASGTAFGPGCCDDLEYCEIRYHPGLFVMLEVGISLLSSANVLRLVDSMAIALGQAYQLARARLASAASPILRLIVQRDQAVREVDLLRREAEIFRAQRESIPPHRRPD